MTAQWYTVRALSVVLIAIAQIAGARAGCFEQCLDQCNSFSDAPVAHGSCTDDCTRASCTKSEGTISYGAIAYGPRSTAAGWAYDWGSPGDANQTALSQCRKHGSDCQIVATFSNSCASVAAVEAQGVFSVGTGRTRAEAQAGAIAACSRQYGAGCAIEAWTCAFP
jgi:Domain of unknown function (DUF4189)